VNAVRPELCGMWVKAGSLAAPQRGGVGMKSNFADIALFSVINATTCAAEPAEKWSCLIRGNN
jgi:hypothetical protein